MTIQDILFNSGGCLLIALTLIQISPLKINPWSALARSLGKAMNSDVLKEIAEIKATQKETQSRLDDHIQVDDCREADKTRACILQFNNEILRDIPHTKEEFVEILSKIDAYEIYCKHHEDYKNNRAVHAIANIERIYDERLKKHDFLL